MHHTRLLFLMKIYIRIYIRIYHKVLKDPIAIKMNMLIHVTSLFRQITHFHIYLLSTVTHLAGVLNVGHLLLLEYPSVITEAGSRKFNVV